GRASGPRPRPTGGAPRDRRSWPCRFLPPRKAARRDAAVPATGRPETPPPPPRRGLDRTGRARARSQQAFRRAPQTFRHLVDLTRGVDDDTAFGVPLGDRQKAVAQALVIGQSLGFKSRLEQ